jgi:hypothetical protein
MRLVRRVSRDQPGKLAPPDQLALLAHLAHLGLLGNGQGHFRFSHCCGRKLTSNGSIGYIRSPVVCGGVTCGRTRFSPV